VNNQGDFFSAKGNLLNDIHSIRIRHLKTTIPPPATGNHAIECLVNHQKEHAGKPFFHYLAFIAPHFPLHAPQDVIQKYKERYLAGWDEIRKQRFARQKKIGLINTTLSKLEPKVGPPYAFPDAIKNLGPEKSTDPSPGVNYRTNKKNSRQLRWRFMPQ
jgi:arylsulfatase